jgi:hypothetical protein
MVAQPAWPMRAVWPRDIDHGRADDYRRPSPETIALRANLRVRVAGLGTGRRARSGAA